MLAPNVLQSKLFPAHGAGVANAVQAAPLPVSGLRGQGADESLFGVDLCLYAFTGQYPFDKGKIGGIFNEPSVGAAVHHAETNVDFGGSHVGYSPGPGGGSFGRILRPLHTDETSTDCGALMALLAPYKAAYDDAGENIEMFQPEDDDVLASIPNEFLQPGWSSGPIKLLVDIEAFTRGPARFDRNRPWTRTLAGRSLFRVSPAFLDSLPASVLDVFRSPEPVSIGSWLTEEYFHIFDTRVAFGPDGVPEQRLVPYVKYALASRRVPFPLKAAVINTNIEYNRLTDCVRSPKLAAYAFASFTGVFIDMFDERINAYVNLFQPVGLSVKPAGRCREFEMGPDELHHVLDGLTPAEPHLPLSNVLGYDRPDHVLDAWTFAPDDSRSA
ncbi:MAG: hypothetical protein MUF54_26230 [Polyangiaceae bacterium]|nr:hypothetical protein [Polyangiaceae bacterium]